MVNPMFTKEDAHKHMENLDELLAQRWVQVANKELNRLKSIDAKNWECRTYAVKKANKALQGATE